MPDDNGRSASSILDAANPAGGIRDGAIQAGEGVGVEDIARGYAETPGAPPIDMQAKRRSGFGMEFNPQPVKGGFLPRTGISSER